MPSIPVIIYPASVQGLSAPKELIEAFRKANERKDCDVLLLVRGGGSIEDLWAFNDETLARCIASSHIPVIAGIGHESDVTIADFAADWRAPTPTAAATQSCPSWQSLERQLQHVAQTMQLRWQTSLRRFEQHTDRLARQLKAPSERLQERAEWLQRLSLRLRSPDLDRLGEALALRARRLGQALETTMKSRESQLDVFSKQLELLSPQRILERGYALVTDENGRLVRKATALAPGDMLDVSLAEGLIQVEVTGTGD
jgi:exodeoxyribonuclease VII large subunit